MTYSKRTAIKIACLTTFLNSIFLAPAALTPTANAHEQDHPNSSAMDHAPIGVMADHRHKAGELMFSYRFMSMQMGDSLNGTDEMSSDDIVTAIANPFFGQTGQPPTLRVAPTKMSMEMHMFGAMLGLNDDITLMAMMNYLRKDMDHLTYQGGMGTAPLGEFHVTTQGLGDMTLGAIIGLEELLDSRGPNQQFNVTAAISLPIGSLDETATVLTPMNTAPTLRAPYAMQLGTGSYDLRPNLTYMNRAGNYGWGGQIKARLSLGPNDQGYQYGDQLLATTWAAYEPRAGLSLSGRLSYSTQGRIEGKDQNIMAPVQTADPENYGGQKIDLAFGVNWLAQDGLFKGHRLAAELSVPIYQDLNGPQMRTDHGLTLAWQKAF